MTGLRQHGGDSVRRSWTIRGWVVDRRGRRVGVVVVVATSKTPVSAEPVVAVRLVYCCHFGSSIESFFRPESRPSSGVVIEWLLRGGRTRGRRARAPWGWFSQCSTLLAAKRLPAAALQGRWTMFEASAIRERGHTSEIGPVLHALATCSRLRVFSYSFPWCV